MINKSSLKSSEVAFPHESIAILFRYISSLGYTKHEASWSSDKLLKYFLNTKLVSHVKVEIFMTCPEGHIFCGKMQVVLGTVLCFM